MFNESLRSSSYDTWDASMSLSMSMSMPATTNAPSTVVGVILTPPPSLITDSSKSLPTSSPGIRKTNAPNTALINRTDDTIVTISPSSDDLFRNNTEVNLISNNKNEKSTKLTPVGFTFLALSPVVMGTIVGMLVVRRRHRRQQRGIKL